MSPTIILIIFLSLFIFEFLVDWFLDILNINAALKAKDNIPESFRPYIGKDRYRKSVEYTLRRGRFGLFLSVQGRIITLAVLFTGAADVLESAMTAWTWAPFFHGLAFLLIANAVLSVLTLPTALYSRFVIEEEFGLNTMGPRLFLSDLFKQALVGIVIVALLFAGFQATISLTGRWWWLASWGVFIAFQLLANVIYPTVVAPLFNTFSPLEEGSLKDRLMALADRTSFPNRGLYVMDGSRRSRRSNAYFSGFGRLRRIVLFDTLIETLDEDQIEAVLAHEIGHWKHKHIPKTLIGVSLLSLGAFALMGLLLNWETLFLVFGFSQPSLHGLLLWVSLFSGPFTACLSPLGNLWSRKNEYQADAYAVGHSDGVDSMKGALVALSKDNLSNLNPHPAYSFWRYSHPAPIERLSALESLRKVVDP